MCVGGTMGIMPARADTYQGCKSWSAPLAKPHGDHHHTHMHDECPCNHAYTQVPIQTGEKLWTTALVSGVTSTKVLLF